MRKRTVVQVGGIFGALVLVSCSQQDSGGEAQQTATETGGTVSPATLDIEPDTRIAPPAPIPASEIAALDAASKSGPVRAGAPDYLINSRDRDDRSQTFVVRKIERGTSKDISESVVIRYCSDGDGCVVRMGMANWDDTGRMASRQSLFFYNRNTKVWRSEAGDVAGTNNNNTVEHAFNHWACYLTDGKYNKWSYAGTEDKQLEFGLLSWNQYNADCFLTFIN